MMFQWHTHIRGRSVCHRIFIMVSPVLHKAKHTLAFYEFHRATETI